MAIHVNSSLGWREEVRKERTLYNCVHYHATADPFSDFAFAHFFLGCMFCSQPSGDCKVPDRIAGRQPVDDLHVEIGGCGGCEHQLRQRHLRQAVGLDTQISLDSRPHFRLNTSGVDRLIPGVTQVIYTRLKQQPQHWSGHDE